MIFGMLILLCEIGGGFMTKQNNHGGSENQSAPELGGRLNGDAGNNNKGNDYNSKRGSKSKREH